MLKIVDYNLKDAEITRPDEPVYYPIIGSFFGLLKPTGVNRFHADGRTEFVPNSKLAKEARINGLINAAAIGATVVASHDVHAQDMRAFESLVPDGRKMVTDAAKAAKKTIRVKTPEIVKLQAEVDEATEVLNLAAILDCKVQ
jgi:hypothetical protein